MAKLAKIALVLLLGPLLVTQGFATPCQAVAGRVSAPCACSSCDCTRSVAPVCCSRASSNPIPLASAAKLSANQTEWQASAARSAPRLPLAPRLADARSAAAHSYLPVLSIPLF